MIHVMEGYITWLDMAFQIMLYLLCDIYEMKYMYFFSKFVRMVRMEYKTYNNSILSRLCPDGIYFTPKQLTNIVIHTSS